MFQRVLNKSPLIICITHNSSNYSLYEISFTPCLELLPSVKSLTKVSLQWLHNQAEIKFLTGMVKYFWKLDIQSVNS